MATAPVMTVRTEIVSEGGRKEFAPEATWARGVQTGTVDTDRLAGELHDIIASLGKVVQDGDVFRLPLPLKTMEVGLTITAEGSVGFLGTGATLKGEGSIILTFERGSAEPELPPK